MFLKFLGNEIELLRKRQNELTALTKVDDIIQLATLTGYDLDFQSTDDARQLLKKVSDALERYGGEDRVEKFALLRLKTIIQERSDYLPTINYINWVIQIKIRFKKQLLSKLSDIEDKQATLSEEYKSTKDEIQTLTQKLNMLAGKIRYYWAKPIAYLNADICYAYKELDENEERRKIDKPRLCSERKDLFQKLEPVQSEYKDKKRKKADVMEELKRMANSHSSDQWKWTNLHPGLRAVIMFASLSSG